MKVFYKNLIKAYTGKCDGLVYYYDPELERILCRRYVKPRPTPQNARLAATMQNLNKLNLSQEYITDLKFYAAMARKPGTRLSWQNVFTKLMYALQRESGTDLTTITKGAVYEQNLPCRTVKTAIEAGLLEPILDYARLNAGM
ncbi:MAG: hypothetical protein PHF32_08360 [Candidatus Cloacimonetes bacterium]|nr:hypothetical protein [Candidatus Cloacimonadota bacterium]